MQDNVISLEDYRKSHPMDLDTVLQIGLDICAVLEKGQPHAEISSSVLCVTDNWEFVFDEDAEIIASDAQGDIYALGMLMYRLLNKGRLPFMPPYPQKISKEEKDEAVDRILAGEEFPIPADGNEQIAVILQKACEANRYKRYQTATEMRTALLTLTAGGQTAQKNSHNASGSGGTQKADAKSEQKKGSDTTGKKDKGKTKKKSASAIRLAGPQGIFIILAAVVSIVFIYVTGSVTLNAAEGMIVYLYGLLQIFLLILSMRKSGILKVVGIFAILDILYVILYDIYLGEMLMQYGISISELYKPGYLAVILPIAGAILYWIGAIANGRLGFLRGSFCAVLMLICAVVMLLLEFTGYRPSISGVSVYPYLAGIIFFVLAILVMESRANRMTARVFAFLSIVLVIVFVLVSLFGDWAALLGISEDILKPGVLLAMVLCSLITCLFSGRRKKAA